MVKDFNRCIHFGQHQVYLPKLGVGDMVVDIDDGWDGWVQISVGIPQTFQITGIESNNQVVVTIRIGRGLNSL